MEQFKINGVLYETRPQAETKPKYKPTKELLSLLAMASVYQISAPYSASPKEKSFSVDIVKEFELIQQKKSTLPRSTRNWVIQQFNKAFRQVVES
jgi:hypothetical protein